MFRETRYHEYYLELEPGDVLVLYTDGATEALSPSGEEFGRERLAQAVKEAYDRPAREMIATLQMAILEWTDQAGCERRRYVLHYQSAQKMNNAGGVSISRVANSRSDL